MLEKKIKIKNLVISFLIIIIGVVFLGLYLKNIDLNSSMDYKIMNYVQTNNFIIKNATLFRVVKLITYFGNAVTYFIVVPPILIYLYYKKKRRDILFLLTVLIFSYLLNEIIKFIVSRQRPVDFFVIYMSGCSFPSGHAMNTTSFYLSVIYVLKNIKTDKFSINKYLIYMLYFLICTVPVSRIVLGVHWPTDVLVGFFVGFLIYKISTTLYNLYWRS